MKNKVVVKLGEAKASLERKKYKSAVLNAWDQMKRSEKRELFDKRSEVERKARNTF